MHTRTQVTAFLFLCAAACQPPSPAEQSAAQELSQTCPVPVSAAAVGCVAQTLKDQFDDSLGKAAGQTLAHCFGAQTFQEICTDNDCEGRDVDVLRKACRKESGPFLFWRLMGERSDESGLGGGIDKVGVNARLNGGAFSSDDLTVSFSESGAIFIDYEAGTGATNASAGITLPTTKDGRLLAADGAYSTHLFADDTASGVFFVDVTLKLRVAR